MARAIADSPLQRTEDALYWDAARLGIRLIGMAFLLIAVWQIRDQVRARVAAAGVALRSRDLAPRASAVPLPVAVRTGPIEGAPSGRPPADDDFWRRVAALATGRRSEIAVLAVIDAVDRRWLLIPETGDLGVVRSTVPPGAVVTAYPEPPDASATKGFTPRVADEYHGYLEDAESGAVRYQSVKPNRIRAFLAQARRARRWALYPVDSPEALTALMPPGR